MAREYGRIKVGVWEQGSEFRLLPIDAQWAYAMLVSQPMISMCGVLPYVPRKWAKLASDLRLERLEGALRVLEADWYLIVDRETDELLVRTFIRHDEPWRNIKLLTGARNAFDQIESGQIRDYLLGRHAWLDDECGTDEVKKHEEERASERRIERSLQLPFERRIEGRMEGRIEPPSEPARGRATATTTTDATATTEEDVSSNSTHPSRAREADEEPLLEPRSAR